MQTKNKNYFNFFEKFSPKFIFGIIFCLLVRLIPVRVPNVEPILATVMPFSKKSGALVGFSFGFFSILLYDIITGTLGVRTLFTAGAYGLIGLLSAVYFKKKEASIRNFVSFAIPATFLYDALTGLTVGPIFFHQSFLNSVLGQIPFTLLHLTGNIIFAIILSPAIYNLLIKKKKQKSTEEIIKNLEPKII